MRLDITCKHKFSSGFTLDADLSCEVNCLALFGPSGSGKTTLLSTIAGIFTPQSGRVRIGEQVVFDSNAGLILPPERRSIGVTPQHSLLFEHLTVRGNLEFGMPKKRKWKRNSPLVSGREIKLESVVDVLELGDLLDRYPAGLSGGQRQRVAIGRALLSQPGMLVLDEPLSSLDRQLTKKIVGYLKAVIELWHIPTLIITHDAQVVFDLADTAVLVNEGTIIAIGSPRHVMPR